MIYVTIRVHNSILIIQIFIFIIIYLFIYLFFNYLTIWLEEWTGSSLITVRGIFVFLLPPVNWKNSLNFTKINFMSFKFRNLSSNKCSVTANDTYFLHNFQITGTTQTNSAHRPDTCNTPHTESFIQCMTVWQYDRLTEFLQRKRSSNSKILAI